MSTSYSERAKYYIKRCLIIIVAFQAAINNFRNVVKLQTNQTSD